MGMEFFSGEGLDLIFPLGGGAIFQPRGGLLPTNFFCITFSNNLHSPSIAVLSRKPFCGKQKVVRSSSTNDDSQFYVIKFGIHSSFKKSRLIGSVQHFFNAILMGMINIFPLKNPLVFELMQTIL